MLDGIKAIVKILKSHFNNCQHLVWIGEFIENNGEITGYKRCKYRGLTFVIKPCSEDKEYCNLEIRGSIHKWFNQGQNNVGRLSFHQMVASINELCYILGIEPLQIRLQYFEANVDLYLIFQQIQNNLVCFRRKGFRSMDEQDDALGVECMVGSRLLKIYNKARQSHIPDMSDLLRFELKFKGDRGMPKGIRTLADLQDISKIYPLYKELVNAADNIIWTNNNIDTNSMPAEDRIKWEQYGKPNYWKGLNHKTAYRYIAYQKELLKKYGGSPIDLNPLIIQKWNESFNR